MNAPSGSQNLLAAWWVFLFLFPFGGGFFLFVLLEGRRREEPQRQPAKGVSSAGLSNGFADLDSRNAAYSCPARNSQPVKRQVLKVKKVQVGNLLTCTGLQEKACAFMCVL